MFRIRKIKMYEKLKCCIESCASSLFMIMEASELAVAEMEKLESNRYKCINSTSGKTEESLSS